MFVLVAALAHARSERPSRETIMGEWDFKNAVKSSDTCKDTRPSPRTHKPIHIEVDIDGASSEGWKHDQVREHRGMVLVQFVRSKDPTQWMTISVPMDQRSSVRIPHVKYS